ncbi:MAG: ribbon-helix-helix protein, CopG family [Bacillota bacterium]
MKRKQIYLEEEMVKKIEHFSNVKNVSQAEIIRRAIDYYFRERQIEEKDSEPLLELAGIVDVDIEDGSENHDKYLYGGRLNE